MSQQDPLVLKTDKNFRDSLTSVDDQGHRVFFHPKKPVGRYYDRRKILSYVLLFLLFAGPFMRLNGHPFMLFNILERKFILFGVAFWPQDFSILVLGFITMVVFIVLFTAVFGRLFCGWVCPQTIFMEMLFRRIEYWIDGDYKEQKALVKAPWNATKIRKRVLKFVIFFGLSFLIANTFLAYIIGSDQLLTIITEPVSKHIGGFISITIFTGIFFFVFWWFREQACTIVCPYGRLQGVLLDKNSINVTYDFVRGEPRGKHGRNRDESLGDCIDCNQCVVVCPTGIDIRNGTQLECVNCTACIDACDEVMDKVEKPRGLIRYASYNGILAKTKGVFTTRVMAYSVVLTALISLFSYLLTTRTATETSMLRARGTLFTPVGEQELRNVFMVKTINKTFDEKTVSFRLKSPARGKIEQIGSDFVIPAQGYREGGMFVTLYKEDLTGSRTKVELEVIADGEVLETVKTSFYGPAQ